MYVLCLCVWGIHLCEMTELRAWLKNIGEEAYAPNFLSEKFDLDAVMVATDDTLKYAFLEIPLRGVRVCLISTQGAGHSVRAAAENSAGHSAAGPRAPVSRRGGGPKR